MSIETIPFRQKGDAGWYRRAIFYELHPRSFRDGNGDGIGDFKGIREKLDYLISLGVDCLWLLPICPSPLKDDGYDITDFYNVHPDLGTLDDFKQLVETVHQRGMRIIIDLVLNHTSDQCHWFQEARASRDSPYRDYYVWSDTAEKYPDARIIFLDTEKSNWSWDEQASQYYWHRFYAHQPDLNYDNPRVQDEVIRIIRFWLNMGIDGFRADAVPYLFERGGTNCENLPETHDFLKRLRRTIDREYPGRILLAEANQWPKDLRPYFGEGDEFHMAFHFPLMPRLFKSLALEDSTAVVDILRDTPEIPPNCQWCTFLRNHDELTLEMVSEADRQLLWRLYAPNPRMKLNLGIRRRLAPLLDGDIHKILFMYSLIFTLPGTPIIYYGDEIGMGDNIWLDDRDGLRAPMQWDALAGAGFSTADPQRFFLPRVEDPVYSYLKVNVLQQSSDPGSLLNQLKELIQIRKNHPVLGAGDYHIIPVSSSSVLAHTRTNQDCTLLALHNLSSKPQDIRVPNPFPEHSTIRNLLTESGSSVISSRELVFKLQPFQFLWLANE